MRFTSETAADGVSEHLFIVGDIHGVLWTPTNATGTRPLVLLAHGGGQHKKAPGLLARAHRYVTARGFAVAAIDAPGHGDRSRTSQDEQHAASIRRRMAAGEPVGPQIVRYNAECAAKAVPEWRTTLDALRDIGRTSGSVGFWGVSMGSAIGIPLVAAEPRIGAAVFGLADHAPLAEAAAQVTVTVEFLLPSWARPGSRFTTAFEDTCAWLVCHAALSAPGFRLGSPPCSQLAESSGCCLTSA